MRTISTAFVLCALVLAGACSNEQTSATTEASPQNAAVESAPQLTPEQLGELGAQISKNPSEAERLLSQRGLTQQTFEQAVRKVSEDPAAAKRYTAAYKKAAA